MSHLRYTAGTHHPFVVLDIKRGERFLGPSYVPWIDELKSVQVFNLLCESHHRVPNHWDSGKDRVPCHDGFVFRQDDGTEWHNQFPDYSNQQMSDDNDWTCHRSITAAEHAADKTRWPVVHAHDAIKYIERVWRGVNELQTNNSLLNATMLKEHLDDVKRLTELATGFSVITVPYAIQPLDVNEKLFLMDDWPKVKLMTPVET